MKDLHFIFVRIGSGVVRPNLFTRAGVFVIRLGHLAVVQRHQHGKHIGLDQRVEQGEQHRKQEYSIKGFREPSYKGGSCNLQEACKI